MVKGEVVDLVEEDNEDIRLPLNPSLTTTVKYIHNFRGLLAKRRSRITPLPRKGVNMNIYVGNLSLEVTEEELRREFMAFGEVISAIIMSDKYIGSGQLRGYGFIEMASKAEGEAAITGLNGKAIKERTIVVNEARPRTDNRSGGSYGDRRGSNYGGGRGGGFGGGRQRRY